MLAGYSGADRLSVIGSHGSRRLKYVRGYLRLIQTAPPTPTATQRMLIQYCHRKPAEVKVAALMLPLTDFVNTMNPLSATNIHSNVASENCGRFILAFYQIRPF